MEVLAQLAAVALATTSSNECRLLTPGEKEQLALANGMHIENVNAVRVCNGGFLWFETYLMALNGHIYVGSETSVGWTSAVAAAVSMLFVLSACDRIVWASLTIESKVAIAPACLERAYQDLGADVHFVPQQGEGSSKFYVERQRSAVDVLIQGGGTEIQLGFDWHGQVSREEERGTFRLLDDMHEAIMRECNLQSSQTSTRKDCSARLCEEWLRGNGALWGYH